MGFRKEEEGVLIEQIGPSKSKNICIILVENLKVFLPRTIINII